jgi:membrane-bound lytic murein transglycosylase A
LNRFTNPTLKTLMNRYNIARCAIVLMICLTTLTGCKKAPLVEEPDYSRMLPPGQSALRKITDPAQLPDLKAAFERKDKNLDAALAHSLAWFAKPSTKQFYPFEGMTHTQCQASVFAFRQLLSTAGSASEFERLVREDFDTYISVGWNMQGDVLMTGYYSPVFTASRTQTDVYKYPLYKRPADLLTDPVTGKFVGRKTANGTEAKYPTRAQIESSGLLRGTELVWLKDKFEAYVVHVNGSAKLSLTDGSSMYVGFSGYNGYDYASVRQALIEAGKLTKNRANLATMTDYFKQHPQDIDTYLNKNDRYVFFAEYSSNDWPAGSLGEKVTALRSLATDKTIFPRANVMLVQTSWGGANAGKAASSDDAKSSGAAPGLDDMTLPKFNQFMLDQDTGGAIRAPGRADIYMGVGPESERWAGNQFAIGHMYYMILKPEKVQKWSSQVTTPAKAGAVSQGPVPMIFTGQSDL